MAVIQVKVPDWLDRICAWPVLLYRQWKYGYDFRRICLGEDVWTILDQQDYYRLGCFRWSFMGNGGNIYAVRSVRKGKEGFKILPLHKEIMKPRKGRVIDHRNTNSLDNRRDNLRYATRAQNAGNCKKRNSKTTSRYMGVHFSKASHKWASKLMCRGKEIWIGSFKSEEEAARAYDKAAKKYRGEFARLNFPELAAETAEGAKR